MESFIYLFAWINLKTGFHLECFFKTSSAFIRTNTKDP